ncbi:hypothetical protein TSAR_005232 [Trichomalopsis sarcophagae]|uniref:BTB domain-containing protein n=1 Tax=Trichomalopsis sarcophagae TaxID=543379 RepID=A0A232EG98_9HYME|nr:hypothetical protein TSAR_005232 [Trichomalopsis sarcophagae]
MAFTTNEEIKKHDADHHLCAAALTVQDNDDLSCLVDECAALTLQDGELVILHCTSEGKAVKAHKRVLARSSPVFANMLNSHRMKHRNILEILDVAYDVLVEMIRFVYAGRVGNIDALVGELATAADIYALNGLKIMCEERMIENLSLDNAIGYLHLADRLRMDGLKGRTIEFIFRNASEISDKAEFKILPDDMLCKLSIPTFIRYTSEFHAHPETRFLLIITHQYTSLNMSGIVNEETKAAEQESQEQINDANLSRFVDNFSTVCLANNKNKAAGEMIHLFCATKGKSIKVHKSLFAHKSSVFADMFVTAKKMEQDVVVIPDTEYNVLEEMVRYVYSGKVRNIDALAAQLAVVADTYGLDGLKTMCEVRMSNNFSLDNVIGRLEVAEKLKMHPVMEKAMTFIVDNAVKVSAKPEFQKLSGHILSELFSKLANAP